MSRPNIVFLCTDQQRADSLGCAGNPVARTPNIDAIAASGTRFARHITPCQMCMPSRSTLFTGLFPRRHGVVANGYSLDESLTTLPDILADNGYRTHGVGKHHLQPLLAPAELNLPDSRPFWKTEASRTWTGPYYGLQTIDLLMGEADSADIAGHYANWLREMHPEATGKLSPTAAAVPPPPDLEEVWRCALPAPLHYNSWITDRALDFIDRATAETSRDPFFLFVSWPDPHHPFSPPGEWADRWTPDDMPLPRVDPGELDRMPPYYRTLPIDGGPGMLDRYWAADDADEQGLMTSTAGISDNTMRRAIAHTYAMIEMIDDGIGRIRDRIASSGLSNETIFVFTSDHGEFLGTHGLLHKGPPSYRQLTEVAMILSGPGIRAGATSLAHTNHIDVAPTVLDLCGIGSNALAGDGASFAALARGEAVNWRERNYGEFHPRTDPSLYNQTVRTDRWRLTLYPNEPGWGELFDLDADPEEHVNLFGDPAYRTTIDTLSAALAAEFPPYPDVGAPPLCKW